MAVRLASSTLLRSGLVRAAVALNARRPIPRRDRLTIPSFFGSWLATELTVPLLGSQAVTVAKAVRAGEHKTAGGRIGLGLHAIAAGLQAGFVVEALRTGEQFRSALAPHLSSTDLDSRPHSVRAGAVVPVLTGARRSTRTRGIRFASYEVGDRTKSLSLDVYSSGSPGDAPRPALLYIHGGGWIVGDKREQGVPLCRHLAANGWIAVNANYRLSPRHRFPDHIVDVKRAIAWIRDNAESIGADPQFIAVSGGSAGGHLAALAACTANDPELQPGFEDADTSIQAAVPIYGVYDMADSDEVMMPGFRDFVARRVVGDDGDGEKVNRFSPIRRVHADVPPMMILHGDRDVLVPIGQALPFVAELRSTSDHAVVFVDVVGAQHAFEIFPSIRTVQTLEYIERFLDGCRRGAIK